MKSKQSLQGHLAGTQRLIFALEIWTEVEFLISSGIIYILGPRELMVFKP